MKNPLAHVLRWLMLALLLTTAATAARADRAELQWMGRWGQGTIVYERDAADQDPSFSHGLFIGNIIRFDITGWEFPQMRSWRFEGTGGSMYTRPLHDTACAGGFTCPDTDSTVFFRLGAALPGDPAIWQLNLTMPYPYTDDGRIPFFEGLEELGAYLSNQSDDRTYSTLDASSRVSHQWVAGPVPEPEAWLMLGLGLGAMGAASRGRSARPEGRATT